MIDAKEFAEQIISETMATRQLNKVLSLQQHNEENPRTCMWLCEKKKNEYTKRKKVQRKAKQR